MWSSLAFTCVTAGFFFEPVDDRRRTDAKDPDDIPPPTAIERHGDERLFDRGPSSFVSVLEEDQGTRTVAMVAPVALRPMGLLPIVHHLDTLTLGTTHVHKRHRRSPSLLRHGDVLPV
jgi:hypothetical protein